MPPRLLRQDSRRKYQAVVEAAGALFLERGFGGTSMDAVAAQASVSKRTLYSHFENKEALFAAVIEARCASIIPPSLAEAGGVEGSPEKVLTRLGMVFLISIYAPDQIQLFQTMISDSRRFPQVGRMMMEGPVARSQTLISDYLARHAEAGVLAIEHPDLAAAQFMGMLKTDVHMRLLFNQPVAVTRAEIARIASSATRLFLHGAMKA